MGKIKFPRTRRDQIREENGWDEDEAIKIYKPNKKKKGLDIDDGGRDTPQSQQSSTLSGPYGTGKLVQRRVFDTEPTLPIATAESWNQMVNDSVDGGGGRGRATPAFSAHSGAIIQGDSSHNLGQPQPVEDYDDDVFAEGPDGDRERMHLAYNKAANYVNQQHAAPRPFSHQQYYPPSSHHNMSMYTDYEDTYKEPSLYEGAASCREIFFCLWSLGTYLVDLGTDIWLVYLYFKLGDIWWCILTLVFVAVPAITMSVFSLILYVRDWKIVGDKAAPIRWASRLVFLCLQLGPLLRIIDTIIYGCRSRSKKDIVERRKLYKRMLDEDTDSMLLRLFEAFMEAAPQLVLQLYIVTQVGTSEGSFLVFVQVLGMITSLVTLATVLVSFQKSLRLSQPHIYAPLSFLGMMGQFLWRICTVASRVLALALFASHFRYFVFVVVGVHWVGMLAWIIKQETMYCTLRGIDGHSHHSPPFEFCFRVLAAFIHIFCFFNLIEGHTRLRCVVYYSILYMEDVILVIVWYITATTTGETYWYYMPGLVIVCLIFWVGIGFQVLYYMCCHPNNSHVLFSRREIRCWVPCSELSLFQSDREVMDDMSHPPPEGDPRHSGLYIRPESSHLMSDTSIVPSHPNPQNGSENVHVMMRADGPSMRYIPSNASSNTSTSALLPKQASRPYTTQKPAKQPYMPTLPSQQEGALGEEVTEELPPRPVPAPRRSLSKQKEASNVQTTV